MKNSAGEHAAMAAGFAFGAASWVGATESTRPRMTKLESSEKLNHTINENNFVQVTDLTNKNAALL